MSVESFRDALRAEIEAVVARWEVLAAARAEIAALAPSREIEAVKAERAALAAEIDQRRSALAEAEAANVALRARVADLERALRDANERNAQLEEQNRAAMETTVELEQQFSAERRFVTACRGLASTMLGDALKSAAGRDVDATSATYGALKTKGLEVVIAQTFKERGRNVAQAPLLDKERSALAGIAEAAGCELVEPEPGTRFSGASMDRAGTRSDPAEEGNVIECLMPGVRRAGTEGALVLPRVIVASG